VNIDYVTFRVKRVGNKAFEIQVRLSLGKIGIISMNTTMPEFHEALTDIMYKLREKLMKEKSKMLTISKISHRPEEM
jgi:ribosome-associated translation inhibitor RaiA